MDGHYLSVAKNRAWLYKGFILGLLSDDKKSQIRLYRRFVSVGGDKKLEEVMARKKWPSFLGPQDFIDWVKTTCRVVKKRALIFYGNQFR